MIFLSLRAFFSNLRKKDDKYLSEQKYKLSTKIDLTENLYSPSHFHISRFNIT